MIALNFIFNKQVIVLLACFMLWSGNASAQTLPQADIDAATQNIETLQRQLLEQLREQRERDLAPARPPLFLDRTAPDPIPRAPGICRDINTVELRGVTLLPSEEQARIVERFKGTCVGVAELEELLTEVTRAYVLRGYIAVRAYLPQQDLGTGILVIEVIEGQVQRIQVEDGGANSISLKNVAPGVVGAPLNLRDIEQALDQINRLASNDARFEIVAGDQPGDSVIIIRNTPSRLWRISAGFDNQGSLATGRDQVSLTLMADNPLGLNDAISFTHRRAQPYRAQQRASQSDTLTYSVPHGYSTYNLSLSATSYFSLITAPSGALLRTRGDSQSLIAGWDNLWYRDSRNLLRVTGTLTIKESRNFLEDILLQVSSRRLSVLDVDLSYTRVLRPGLLTMSVGYSQGLNAFGALDDPANLPALSPRAQFGKINYHLGLSLPFQIWGTQFTFSSSLVGQNAQDVLYGSEQLSIGGLSSVRGFYTTSLAGDDGFFIRNELAFVRHFDSQDIGHGFVRPFFAVDHGEVRNKVPGVPDGKLTGAAVGVRIGLGAVSAEIFYTDSLSRPQSLQRESGQTWFRLTLAL